MLFSILSFLLLISPFSTITNTSASLLKLPLIPFPSSNPSFLLHSPRRRHPHLPLSSAAPLGSGQYLVRLSLGSPPQPLLLIADTGSDLLFSRCSLSSHHRRPSFLPRHSSSFHPLHCSSPFCRLLPHLPCRRKTATNHSAASNAACHYSYSYSDLSSSGGFLSLETSSPSLITNHPILFGCAFSVSSSSFSSVHGVLGLGNGPLSLPSQLHHASFSYCLMDYTLSPPPITHLILGNATTVHHPHLTFTPFVSNPLFPTYYYVRIIVVSVNGKILRIPPSVWEIDHLSGNGGVIVDSGTTLTFFPKQAYTEILKAMRKAIPKSELKKGPAGFGLCINSSTTNLTRRLPRLSLHFMGGRKMAPPARNYFVEVEEGVRCLGIQAVAGGGGNGGFGVIGNLMQKGFVMVFDRRDSRLGFEFTDCAGM